MTAYQLKKFNLRGSLFKQGALLSVLLMSLIQSPLGASEKKVFVYLIDPADQKTQAEFAQDVWLSENPSAEPPVNDSQKSETPTPPNLDVLIEKIAKRPPLSKTHERILKQVEAEQIQFSRDLEKFLNSEFDPKDENATQAFKEIRESIVKLVFDSKSERAYWERLYLINKTYLEHPEAEARFASLDKAMRDRWLSIEERSRRYRQIILGVAAVGGAVTGGWLSYKISQKIIPVVATEGGVSSITKWVGRATIVVIGAGVGAAAAQYIGFLGSEYLFQRRDYIDPIDGGQDLRDILDVIEATKR